MEKTQGIQRRDPLESYLKRCFLNKKFSLRKTINFFQAKKNLVNSSLAGVISFFFISRFVSFIFRSLLPVTAKVGLLTYLCLVY